MKFYQNKFKLIKNNNNNYKIKDIKTQFKNKKNRNNQFNNYKIN
jgi:hypothetical protein